MIKHQLNVPDFKTMYIFFKFYQFLLKTNFTYWAGYVMKCLIFMISKKHLLLDFSMETQTYFTFTRSFWTMNAVHFSRSLFQQTLQRKWPRWCPSLGIYCRNKVWATKRRSHLFSGGGTVFCRLKYHKN